MLVIKNKVKFFFVVALLGVLLFYLGRVYQEMEDSFNENLPSAVTLLPEDSVLISDSFKRKMRVIEVSKSRVRPPISAILIDSQYYLFLSNIELNSNDQLSDIVHIKNDRAQSTVGVTYTILGIGEYFDLEIKSGPPENVGGVYITAASDSLLPVVATNDLVVYHFTTHAISIQYSKNGPVNFYINGNGKLFFKYFKIPIEILILRSHRRTVLAMMMPTDSKRSIPYGLINKVIATDDDKDQVGKR